MLSLTAFSPSSSARDIQNYLENGVDDYYSQNGAKAALFMGSGLTRLSQSNNVSSINLDQLLYPKDSEGNYIFQKNSGKRVPGFDLTFSSPKSASIAWAISDKDLQQKIECAHIESVKSTINYTESEVNTVSAGKGKILANGQFEVRMEKAELAAAAYTHYSSRSGDMALHSHMILSNCVERSDGRMMSLNSRELYQRKKEIGAIYRSEFASRLQDLGFTIERDKFSFRISGISKDAENHFSQRAQEIRNSMTKKGLDSAKASDVAALSTRKGKTNINTESLQAKWKERASKYGIDSKAIENLANQPKTSKEPLNIGHILEMLTEHHSVFTENKAKETIAIESQGKLDASQIIEFQNEFFSPNNKQLVALAKNGKVVYSSKEMVRIERSLLHTAYTLNQKNKHQVSERVVNNALKQFNTNNGFELSKEQSDAVSSITTIPSDIALVQGSAGTGKTTMLSASRMAWEASGYRVRGAALSGKAAASLKEAGIESKTVASTLLHAKKWVNDQDKTIPAKDPITPLDILVVDEAGMIDSRSMNELISLSHKGGAKIVLIGDTKQLQAIGAGGSMNAIMQHSKISVAYLNESRRQKTDLTKNIVNLTVNKQASAALLQLHDAGKLHLTDTRTAAIEKAVEKWAQNYSHKNINSSVMIANTNADIKALNTIARDELKQNGTLEENKDYLISVQNREGTSLGEKPFTEGDRIIFKKNEKSLGILNGELATITNLTRNSDSYTISANKADGATVNFSTREYSRFDHGYAITTYASQGSTVNNAVVLSGGPMQDFHSSYVQVSRARIDVELVTSKTGIEAQMNSISPTENMIDYAKDLSRSLGTTNDSNPIENQSFAEVRDFLNEHSPKTIENDTSLQFDEIKELATAMSNENIKETSLDYTETKIPDQGKNETQAKEKEHEVDL